MPLADPPPTAAWRHEGSGRTGFEAAAFRPGPGGGWIVAGSTTALEDDGTSWWVGYEIALDAGFRTLRATIAGRSGAGPARTVGLAVDVDGRWTVDGRPVPLLDGCADVDLESSALTNALPARRRALGLGHGEGTEAPAAYVRADGLAVERLEQHYACLPDGPQGPRLAYDSEAFGFSCTIEYDAAGLALTYPGIAVRAA